ncbi:DUF2969 family protein [Agrilactobacillus yilanensis]|uniref:DUF2969 family protein n=1 Tax=Agrilactobacillus yilanensis TaxID=2485997 RepID=A0ABW4J6N7_9LACO|nr:DUF2969 family protein [Agrilactobacillus yilanensis]
MRKKEQNIAVKVNNVTINEKAGYELLINDKKVGVIIEEEPQRFETQMLGDTATKHFKQLDDAINDLLMMYNLHQR